MQVRWGSRSGNPTLFRSSRYSMRPYPMRARSPTHGRAFYRSACSNISRRSSSPPQGAAWWTSPNACKTSTVDGAAAWVDRAAAAPRTRCAGGDWRRGRTVGPACDLAGADLYAIVLDPSEIDLTAPNVSGVTTFDPGQAMRHVRLLGQLVPGLRKLACLTDANAETQPRLMHAPSRCRSRDCTMA